MSRSDTTQLTVSSLNESRTNGSETELQPEDEDKDLEMTLSRHGSFVELYPSMISRIEKARHRQNVSEAADSVMRRYRRWRQNSSRSNLNSTFIVPQTHTSSHSKNVTNKENSNNQKKRQFTRTQPVPHQPTSLQSLQVQRPFPKRETHSPRRQQHQPILVMDFSGASDTSLLRESLNDTFTVSEMSKLKEEPCSYSTSPSRPGYLNAKALLDMSPRSKRFCAPSQQAVGCCRCASETSAVRERPDAYGSPVRQSPLQARMMTSLNTSPRVLSKSPRKHCVESFSREPMRPRSISTSLSSPPRKHFVPLREDSHLSLQLQLRSPRSATGAGHLRRHLSFDSSLPSISASYSPKKLDEDFMKAYHKFVCQNKLSFFNSHPCRLCARSSEASRGHSSSALAALALSPHRSVLRKRHRAVGGDEDPRSKRSRDNCCTSSPGSSRHRIEMLRRCHSPAKLSCDDLPYSSSAHRAFNEFRRQQQEQQRWESADAHQEAWMKRGRPLSAAEFSDLGTPPP